MDNNFQTVAHKIVTDLVTKKLIVKDFNGQLAPVKAIWGYDEGYVFSGEQDAISKLTQALTATYGGLRAAS